MIIKKLELSDILDTLDCVRHFIHEYKGNDYWSPQWYRIEFYKKIFSNELYHSFIARAPDSVKGYIIASERISRPEILDIQSLFVKKDSRGQNIGFQLKSILEYWAEVSKFDSIHTYTPITNTSVIRLNEDLDYSVDDVSDGIVYFSKKLKHVW